MSVSEHGPGIDGPSDPGGMAVQSSFTSSSAISYPEPDAPGRTRREMRGPEKVNAFAIAGVAVLFYVLALTRVGELWEQHPEVRDVYLWIAMFLTVLIFVLRRAELDRIPTLDRWMLGIWIMIGFAVFGLAPLWPVLLLSLLFGAIVRLEAKLAFQSFDMFARRVGIE